MTAWYVLAAGAFRSSRLGLWVVFLAALLPVVRIGAVVMTIDPPLLACWSWALLCVWRGLGAMTGELAWWLTAALLCAVGILAKYTMVLLPVAVVGYLLVHRRHEFRRAGIWVLLAGTLLGWAPILYWNATHHWVTFRHVWGQVGTGKGSGLRWFGPLTFLGGQVGMMFGLWLVAFLAAAWRFRPGRERDPAVRLLWWCSVPVWFVFPLASLLKSGQPNWPAPAYAAGFILAVAWLRDGLNGPHRRHFARCLGVNAALGLVIVAVVHFPRRFSPCSRGSRAHRPSAIPRRSARSISPLDYWAGRHWRARSIGFATACEPKRGASQFLPEPTGPYRATWLSPVPGIRTCTRSAFQMAPTGTASTTSGGRIRWPMRKHSEAGRS